MVLMCLARTEAADQASLGGRLRSCWSWMLVAAGQVVTRDRAASMSASAMTRGLLDDERGIGALRHGSEVSQSSTRHRCGNWELASLSRGGNRPSNLP